MKLEADDVLAIRAVDPPGLRRMMQISFAAHVVVTLAVLLGPSDWFRREPVEPIRMTISLGDGTGARLSGRTPAPGRTVERVEPERPRETVRPAASPQQTMAVPETVTRTPPPKPPETKAPPGPLPRPPAAGQQVQRGRAMTETGNVGESTGLASGGEQGGARTDLGADFCCPEWVGAMTSKIDGNWHPPAGMTGLVIIGFTVSQNGAITNVKVAQSSGNGLLDRVAQFALLETMKTGLPPLPAAYTEPTLTVRLSFPYGAR